MDSRERAEKIVSDFGDLMSFGGGAKSWLISTLTSQLGEAVREALDQNCECSGEAHNSTCPWYMDKRIRTEFMEGFAAAREKVKTILKRKMSEVDSGDDNRACWESYGQTLEEIRQMEA